MASGWLIKTSRDLSTCVRRTRGSSIPPPLVGFSSTVIGDHLYIFGGRLVQVRRMVSDLWALDLHTLVWEKLWPPFNAESGQDAESEAASYPQPRYFHRYVAQPLRSMRRVLKTCPQRRCLGYKTCHLWRNGPDDRIGVYTRRRGFYR